MLIKTMFRERLPHISCVFPLFPLYFQPAKTDFVSRAVFPFFPIFYLFFFLGSVTIFQPCDRMNERRACDSSGSANAGQNCTGHAGAENEWKVQARARENRVENRLGKCSFSLCVFTPSWAGLVVVLVTRKTFINKRPKKRSTNWRSSHIAKETTVKCNFFRG